MFVVLEASFAGAASSDAAQEVKSRVLATKRPRADVLRRLGFFIDLPFKVVLENSLILCLKILSLGEFRSNAAIASADQLLKQEAIHAATNIEVCPSFVTS